MCLLNYNKNIKNYKHITYAERTMIERWYNQEHRNKKEIAMLLNKSERTIRREIKRGIVIVRGYMWEEKEEYSAQIAQERYEYNKTGKGPGLKLDQDIKLVEHIEEQIIKEKKSPEVVAKELYKYGFNIEISGRTIRNGIKSGLVFNKIKQGKIIYKKEFKDKNKEKRVSKLIPAEKSIEYRPKEANKRSEYGHWEGDLVIGTKKRGAVLFTLTERKTREEIIVKIPGKKAEYVAKALDKIEKRYKKIFYKKFKTITFDNGGEFRNWKSLEKSYDKRRKTPRVQVYYAHPYRSGERGSNENANRLIRRFIPKGIDITPISEEFIQYIENWINNYPRAMFKYKSTNEIISELCT